MDALWALRLQLEWGADEALLDAPVDRLSPVVAAAGVAAGVATGVAVGALATELRPVQAVQALAPPSALAAAAAAAADSLEALQRAIDGFEACPLRATASRTVAPSGNAAAKLVMVAEAPGPDDDRSGQAFSGAAGMTLDRVLGSAGLGRDSLLLAFLIPWRPPGGRAPNEAETSACLPFLHRLLALTAPRRVALLGAGPLRALTGASGIRQARGRWTQAIVPGLPEPIEALPMLAPELWMKTAMNKQNTWLDLLALHERLSSG